MANDRDCENCIHKVNGACNVWDCEFDPKFGTWIPVSEDLPKDAYGCIVTVLDVDPRTQNEYENILPYFVGYDGETWNNADGEPIPYEVIAWMKAPEPYNAEGSEKE